MKIIAARKILWANEQIAAENRARFQATGVCAVNVLGSPGAGKTTLLESLFRRLQGRLRPAVIEGDIAGSIDARRIERLGLPVVQINTEGACHLDAHMVAAAIEHLELQKIDLLVIENVGNLVCPAGFDLGEHARILVLSVSEGDDKAAKYPAIFRNLQVLFVTKTDLLPQCDFRVERLLHDFRRLSPAAAMLQVSARTGDGIEEAALWMQSLVAGVKLDKAASSA